MYKFYNNLFTLFLCTIRMETNANLMLFLLEIFLFERQIYKSPA